MDQKKIFIAQSALCCCQASGSFSDALFPGTRKMGDVFHPILTWIYDITTIGCDKEGNIRHFSCLRLITCFNVYLPARLFQFKINLILSHDGIVKLKIRRSLLFFFYRVKSFFPPKSFKVPLTIWVVKNKAHYIESTIMKERVLHSNNF